MELTFWQAESGEHGFVAAYQITQNGLGKLLLASKDKEALKAVEFKGGESLPRWRYFGDEEEAAYEYESHLDSLPARPTQ